MALVLNGKTFAESTMVVALGIRPTGGQTVSGLRRDGFGEREGVDPVLAAAGRAGQRPPRAFWGS